MCERELKIVGAILPRAGRWPAHPGSTAQRRGGADCRSTGRTCCFSPARAPPHESRWWNFEQAECVDVASRNRSQHASSLTLNIGTAERPDCGKLEGDGDWLLVADCAS